MSVRDILKKEQPCTIVPDTRPSWVINGTDATKALYDCAVLEYERISSLITSNKASSPKDRKLVSNRIALLAKKDRSIISARRQPDLVIWLANKNSELDSLAKSHGLRKRNPKPASKSELLRTISDLRSKLKSQVERDSRTIIEAFFESNLLDDRDKLARDNSRLRLDNELLQDKVTRLQKLCQDQEKQLASVYSATQNRNSKTCPTYIRLETSKD